MKHLKTYESIENTFHCFISDLTVDIFNVALSKLNIPSKIKREIHEHLDFDIHHNSYVGIFLRFNLPNWDFYQIYDINAPINDISRKLINTTYNSSELGTAISTYIGEIKVSEEDIKIYKQTQKYNL